MDGQRPLLGKAGANAVGAFVLLAPDAARPGPHRSNVSSSPQGPCVPQDSLPVGDQNAASHAADGEEEPVEARLRGPQHGLEPLPRFGELLLFQPLGRAPLRGVEAIKGDGPLPGGNKGRTHRPAGTDGGLDPVGMLRRNPVHQLAPPRRSPPASRFAPMAVSVWTDGIGPTGLFAATIAAARRDQKRGRGSVMGGRSGCCHPPAAVGTPNPVPLD